MQIANCENKFVPATILTILKRKLSRSILTTHANFNLQYQDRDSLSVSLSLTPEYFEDKITQF